MKMRSLVAHGRRVAVGLAVSVAVPVVAFAQDSGAIDTSDVVSTIEGGLTAIAAIGAAFLSFKYLKKVWSRL